MEKKLPITVKNQSMKNALKIQSYAVKNRMDVNIDLFNDVNQAFDVVINTTPLGMYEQEDKHDFSDGFLCIIILY